METYSGWANRETWAFVLHLSNDQGLYEWATDFGRYILDFYDGPTDRFLGERLVSATRDLLADCEGAEWVDLMRDDVGSWWRVDECEVGRAVREWVES